MRRVVRASTNVIRMSLKATTGTMRFFSIFAIKASKVLSGRELEFNTQA